MIFWIEQNSIISYNQLIIDLKNININTNSSLPGYDHFLKLIKNLTKGNVFNSIDELHKFLLHKSFNQNFIIQTSGTTSDPKNINVSFKKCIRQVKIKHNQEQQVWANCYPFISFACTQVFFQAFFNNDVIVYCFDNNFKSISDVLIKEKVTNLACTPTFLNMLIINADKKNNHIKTITTGGEKLNESILKSYKLTFPNAKYINIYASTEVGSLLYSNSNVFKIQESLKQHVKIHKNELLVHKKLINDSIENNFINDWFHTGDEVTMVDHESFIFKIRKSNYINTGGYRVNPIEIEDSIINIDGIDDVRVFGKKNSILGTIICAEIISSKLDIKQIKLLLKSKLENFKIPQIIKMVNELSLTKSGKKSRIL